MPLNQPGVVAGAAVFGGTAEVVTLAMAAASRLRLMVLWHPFPLVTRELRLPGYAQYNRQHKL